jgi:hypothetical protein
MHFMVILDIASREIADVVTVIEINTVTLLRTV